MCIGGILSIHLIETTTGGEEVERLVEDEKWFGQGVDDRQGEPLGLSLILEPSHGDVLAGSADDWRTGVSRRRSASRSSAESRSLGWITKVRVVPLWST